MQFAQAPAEEELGGTAASLLRGLLSSPFGTAAATPKTRVIRGVGLRHSLLRPE